MRAHRNTKSKPTMKLHGNLSRMLNKYHLVLLFALVIVLRLLPHAPNMAPLTAFAIIIGMYFHAKWGLFLPLLASLVTDIFLGFHSTMLWVYGSYVLIYWLSQKTSSQQLPKIFSTVLAASVLFFVITNFGVWASGEMYDYTLSGLMACYTLALPFFRNALMGDIFYTSLFVGLIKILPTVKTGLSLFRRPVVTR